MCQKNCPDCVCNGGNLQKVTDVARLYKMLVETPTGVYVKFTKANGDVTTRELTLSPVLIPEEAASTSSKNPETKSMTLEERVMDIRAKDYISVWSLTDNGWRTIKPSRVERFAITPEPQVAF